MKKRVLNVLLATLVLSMLAFTGCSKSDKKSKDEDIEEADDDEDESDKGDEVKIKAGDNKYGSWFPFGMILSYEDNDEIWQEPSDPIDAEDIYANTTIMPEFLYGQYYYYDENSDTQKYDAPVAYLEKCEWTDLSDFVGYVKYEGLYKDYEIATMPYAFEAGVESYFSEVNGIPGYYWCGLYFAAKKQGADIRNVERYEVPAAYEIVGDKVIFHLMTEYEYDYDNNAIDYKFGDKVLEYTFERDALSLSFSDGTQKINMLSKSFLRPAGSDNTGAYLMGEVEEEENIGIPIREITLGASNDLTRKSCYIVLEDGSVTSAGRLTDDGVLTLCAKKDGVVTVYQYVVFDCAEDGVILCDKEGAHYLISTGNWAKEKYGTMKVNNIRPEDMDAFGKLSEETINFITETREDLLDDLASALTDIGLGIKIDEETGDIILDAEVLFASNSAEVSEEGKAQLTEFALALDEILQLDEYKDFIAELHISGHTDSDGDYDYNKELSLKRAEAVRDCILEALADYPEDQEMIESILTVEGCSYDQLIYDEEGNEDKAASRRVVFSFFINVANYVDQ